MPEVVRQEPKLVQRDGMIRFRAEHLPQEVFAVREPARAEYRQRVFEQVRGGRRRHGRRFYTRMDARPCGA